MREHFSGRKTRTFSNKNKADNFAGDMAQWREPFSGLSAAIKILDKLAENPMVRDAVARHDEKKDSAESSPAADILKQFIDSKEKAGMRSNYIAALSCSLNSFSAACPKNISAITQEDIEAWLSSGDYKPKTRKNRFTDLKTFFSWCSHRHLIDRNPTDGVEVPRVPYKSAAIMPVSDIAKLLQACQQTDPALIGYLALILFGGLRSKESARTLPENIHDGIVDIGGDQTKLNVRRCFPIQPILADWLAVPGCEIGGKNLYNRFVAVQKKAGVKTPPNSLRHSAASCWLELLGAKDAAKMLGHSEQTLFRHYASKITAADAKAFTQILPSTVTDLRDKPNE